MTVYWSDAVRNAMLDAWESAINTSAKLRVYAGTVPASEAAALGGATLLVEFSLASDWASVASGGQKSLSSLPLQANASGGGTGMDASFYRIYASDGATCHEQGTVSAAGGGGDAIVDNTLIASGQVVQVTAFTKTMPG